MTTSTVHSADTIRLLAKAYREQGVLRPLRVTRYEPGESLAFDVVGVAPAHRARVELEVLRFVGGGFAGQVYQARLVGIDADGSPPGGLEAGGVYAVKILRPPSRVSEGIRNLLYGIGFQAPFALQALPAASRAGALWQKLIRRAARLRLGDERAVVDIHATFVDPVLGSCGEISEWVEGRNWRFEVDDRITARRRWRPGRDGTGLGSPEYRAKRQFMADTVALLHEVGAPELARQYEWWTLKSQPNCLKRLDAGDGPADGLTAVDFRAGMALPFFLPQSPGDPKLIVAGLLRGSLVQFDRGNVAKLSTFVEAHADEFEDLGGALTELESADREYREGQIDVAHHHVRLLISPRLWGRILDATVTSFSVRNLADEGAVARFRRHRIPAILFAMLGLLPLLGVVGAVTALLTGTRVWPTAGAVAALLVLPALAGRLLRRIAGRADYRQHYGRMLTSPRYLARAFRARLAERLIDWHRAGRVGADRAASLMRSPWRALGHLPLSFLPVFAHRFLTDASYAREKLAYIFVRPIRLYVNAAAREEWLKDMVRDGREKRMLADEDADTILDQVGEPFIQKYLKSLAVHVCTLPVTQVVSLIVAVWYVKAHPELAWEQALSRAGLILAAFQITPISPGSLVRGLYVLYLVIRERNLKDYNIAVLLGFFKYVGYLAFPIQMTYRYPVLARFMAVHWATGAVHIVPVFGEHGAWLEHAVFDLFYNYPLTLRRRMRLRAERRAALPPRRWHALPLAAAAAAVSLAAAKSMASADGAPAGLSDVWPFLLLAAALFGVATTLLGRGTPLGERIRLAAIGGVLAGLLYGLLHAALSPEIARFWKVAGHTVWCIFLVTLVSTLAAVITEIQRPEPRGSTTG